ncbi:MAG TPA: hypothetical protein VM658_16605 [bacterium]|nr:hypothetical protein [bacterium]
MTTPVKHLRLKYPNADQFAKDYPLLREGRLFLPVAKVEHVGAAIILDLQVPGLEEVFSISGRVAMSISPETAKQGNRPAGMWIDFMENSAKALNDLEAALRSNDEYRRKLNLSERPGQAPEVKLERIKPEAPAPAPDRKSAADEKPAAGSAPSSQPIFSESFRPPAPPPSRRGTREKLAPETKTRAKPIPSERIRPAASHPSQPSATETGKTPSPPLAGNEAAGEEFILNEEAPAKAPQAEAHGAAPSPNHPENAIAPSPADEGPELEDELVQPGPKEGPSVAFDDAAADQKPEEAKAAPLEETAAGAPEKSGPPTPEEPEADASGSSAAARPAAKVEQGSPTKTDPDAVEVGWVREVLDQGEVPQEEVELPPEKPGIQERSDLTPKERERLEPVGLFIMDLVKAMAKSAYYEPNHPSAMAAREGLYAQFKEALKDSPEIMITHMITKERTDLLISGVLEGQISVRTVVGAGMAETFIPKLKEYFERKGLLSIALKKDLAEEAFGAFITIMSDPRADRGQAGEQAGAILTKMLAECGVSEVSAVFIDDVIELEDKVSWRVQMAINRLAKDLRVMPMFKNMNEREMRRMKVRIVQDIIRPLRVPALLKEIILNCYVIAKHSKDLDEEDLESSVIASFPFSMLMATSKLIFADLDHLRERQKEDPDSAVIARRLRGAIRIVRLIALRVIEENAPGAREFLEGLYFKEILAFHELPPQVQYRVNTVKLTNDVKDNLEGYVREVEQAARVEDARTLIQCFQRVAPIMIEKHDWAPLLAITRSLHRAGTDNAVFRDGPGDLRNPIGQVFSGLIEDLVKAFDKIEAGDLAAADEIAVLLGDLGVELLAKVLSVSEVRSARKNAVDTLVKIGAPALERVRKILDDPVQAWFLQRNALLIISMIGGGEDDIKRARRFLRHSKPQLREEALNSLVRFEGKAAESALIAALDDSDRRTVRRALAGLSLIQPLSEAAIKGMLTRITSEPGKTRETPKDHEDKIALLIRSIGTMPDPPLLAEIESTLIEVGEKRWKKKGGILKKLRRTLEEEDAPVVLLAVVEALGRLGGPGSAKLLEAVAKDDSPLGAKAKEAANRLQLRNQT